MGKLNMTRRSFVKTAAVSAAVAAVAGAASPTAALAENENAAATESAVTRIRSCCRGCGKVECGVWVYVQDGKVIRTEGDEDCFLTMGNHCSKGQASIQAAYHPDRIKYPMKRTNPKGDDDPGWVRISWDEAYQTIADNILEITEKYGNESTFTWENGDLHLTMGGKEREFIMAGHDLIILPGEFSQSDILLLREEGRGVWGVRTGGRILTRQ